MPARLILAWCVAAVLCAAEITIHVGGEPESLDPGRITGHGEGQLAIGLFEGLVALDARTLEPVPGMAERWERSDDGSQWIFHLRPDLRWSDGSPLTAGQVVASWRRVLDPKTASDYANFLDPIVGAKALREGRQAAFGADAPDDRSVVVRLERACPWFLEVMAFTTCYPVPLDAIARHGERWTAPGHFIGNGPFRLVEHVPRQRLVMERNPFWHGAAQVRLDRITALSIESVDTAWRLWSQGSLHWMSSIPLAKVDEIRWDPGYYVGPALATYFYRCNVTRPPLDDVRVRRALAMGLDRGAITRHVLKAGQVPTRSFTPPMAGYDPPPGLPEDPVAARALLAEAGYSDAKPLPVLDLLFNTSEQHKVIAEAVAAQWRDRLGVRVRLENAEWKVYLARQGTLDYTLSRSAWFGDYQHPSTFLDLFQTGGGNNRCGFTDPAYDAGLHAALAQPDATLAAGLWRSLEARLLDAAPVIPIYHYVTQGLIRDEISGFHPNLRDLHPLHTLAWEPAP